MTANPLLTMFITEARDLLEEISKGLLALESIPGDASTMNGIFRALHTLKGSSGLFEPDLDAIRYVAHAGEDLLDAVRNGHLAFTSEMADPLLDSLDAVGTWLDEIEADGRVAPDAQKVSQKMAVALRRFMQTDANASVVPEVVTQDHPGIPGPKWLIDLPESLQETIRQRREETMDNMVAIRHFPEALCFFTGDDPLHLMSQIPGLVVLWVENPDPWPEMAQLDPFQCVLRFYAVAEAAEEEIVTLFRYVEEQTEISVFDLWPQEATADEALLPSPQELPPSSAVDPVAAEEEVAVRILEAQLKILDIFCAPEEWEARIVPMARVLKNLFSRRKLSDPLLKLDAVVAEARSQRSFAPLRRFLTPLVVKATDLPQAKPNVLTLPASKKVEPSVAEVALTLPASKKVDRSVAEVAASTTDDPDETDSAPKRRATDNTQKDRSLRVDQSRIDRLMDLVGELVVAKNGVPFLAQRAEKAYGVRALGREIMEFFGVINRLSEELQSSVMQIRMMPVSTIFQRFPRLVRDISRKLDKDIVLIMEGGDTEADKNIVEMLADPLIHLVRNSLDHGIESPEVRKAAGKKPQGEIKLCAFQESDRVIIEIHDDGKGVDPEIIKRKAYEKGIITDDRLEVISDHEAIQIIFAAGFSTAEQISDLSGRGVGMDVVRSAVEQVGGSVVVYSKKGEGSRVHLELPMTMAISRVMLIEQSRSLYGVPLGMVSETVRIPIADVHDIKNQEVIVLRGRVLPLVRLRERLRIASQPEDTTPEDLAVLVVRPFGVDIGLVVDDFQKGVDVVIKPLDGILSGLSAYAGGALLGDGRVLLVLNLKELL